MTGGIFRVGNKVFAGGTHIMGILNVTPDSFYAGSRVSADEIVRRALEMVRAGAEVLDIGGESTRPGAAETDAEEEAARVLPAVAAVRAATDCPVSVDTRRAEIARLALRAGADMINDVSGAEGAAIYEEVARPEPAGVEVRMSDSVCGHDRAGGTEIKKLFENSACGSEVCGILVPDVGGAPEDRLPATLAVTERAARAGVLFVRVHDIAENLAAIRRAEEKK